MNPKGPDDQPLARVTWQVSCGECDWKDIERAELLDGDLTFMLELARDAHPEHETFEARIVPT